MRELVYESCHCTWVFDLQGKRFRRILRGVGAPAAPVTTGWRPFFGIEQRDRGGFVVRLNPSGTRLLRSWRHTEGRCWACGAEGSLPEPAAVASAGRVPSPAAR